MGISNNFSVIFFATFGFGLSQEMGQEMNGSLDATAEGLIWVVVCLLAAPPAGSGWSHNMVWYH